MSRTYIFKPNPTWPGYVDIIEQDTGFNRASVPEGEAIKTVAHWARIEAEHWQREIAKYHSGDPHIVIVDGECYHIGQESNDPTAPWKGYGGAPWTIRFFNGRVAHGDSLWHSGAVPEEYRHILPDNATLEWRERKGASNEIGL